MPLRETPRMREAYREYLKLGTQRSMERLHDLLVAAWGPDAPQVDTLRSWSRDFGWQSRVIEDDEIINRRAMDRIRDRLALETEDRRQRRLRLSDIYLTAVLKAMLTKDPQTGDMVPADLLSMHPQTLRAVNDSARLAADIQRIDQGEATTRIGADVAGGGQALHDMSAEAIDEVRRFMGILEEDGQLILDPHVASYQQTALPGPVADDDGSAGAA